jgi:hypothetical protein
MPRVASPGGVQEDIGFVAPHGLQSAVGREHHGQDETAVDQD